MRLAQLSLILLALACDGSTAIPDDIHKAACLVGQLAELPLSPDEARDLTVREAERMALALAACD